VRGQIDYLMGVIRSAPSTPWGKWRPIGGGRNKSDPEGNQGVESATGCLRSDCCALVAYRSEGSGPVPGELLQRIRAKGFGRSWRDSNLISIFGRVGSMRLSYTPTEELWKSEKSMELVGTLKKQGGEMASGHQELNILVTFACYTVVRCV